MGLLPAGPWSRRILAGVALLGVALVGPPKADAATVPTAKALVRWMPGGSEPVREYRIYVRNSGSSYADNSYWPVNPPPDAVDGSLSAEVTYTPAESGTNYFAVVAVSSTSGEESGFSRELPIGTWNRCRNDSCSTKTTCDFSNRPDGTSCEDASFCNGPEVCRAGMCDASADRNCADAIACTVDSCDEVRRECRHTGPPGCCLACNTMDPCLADACARGDCNASPGTGIQVNRIRFLNKASDTKLAAKGSFIADPPIDPPSQTGVVVEMRSPDGVVLYSSSIAASSIKVKASGRRYRFTASRSAAKTLSNGLTRLDLRVQGSTWRVTIKGETPELLDAFLEPTLTLVIRLGATCVRHMDMLCEQSPTISVCR